MSLGNLQTYKRVASQKHECSTEIRPVLVRRKEERGAEEMGRGIFISRGDLAV